VTTKPKPKPKPMKIDTEGLFLPDRQYRQMGYDSDEDVVIDLSFRAVTNALLINTIVEDKPVNTTVIKELYRN
jgi:hypothetical protein